MAEILEEKIGSEQRQLWEACLCDPSEIEATFSSLKISTDTQLFSGTIDTSSRNAILNAIGIEWAASRLKLRKSIDYDYVVEGDDNVLGCIDDKTMASIQFHMASLGFNAKVELCESFDDVVFCSMKMRVYTKMINGRNEQVLMHYKNPESIMRKFGLTTQSTTIHNAYESTTIMLAKCDAVIDQLGNTPCVSRYIDEVKF